MTDPTPTHQASSQGLTDAQLLELAEKELCIDDMRDVIAAMRAAIAADRAARPQPTADDLETRFRAWWAESYPNAPAGPHAVRSHAAFALHLLGGEVAA